MPISTTTCHTVTCDVCNAPMDGLDFEDVPIHWGDDESARVHARDEGWTIAPYGKAVSYDTRVIIGMAVCEASNEAHQAARKLILHGSAR